MASKPLRRKDIGDSGQKHTNAPTAAGIVIVNTHGSVVWAVIGICCKLGVRVPSRHAIASSCSSLAGARGIVSARHAADVYRSGDLLRAVVAYFLGSESDLSAVSLARKRCDRRRSTRSCFGTGSAESLVCLSRCHSASGWLNNGKQGTREQGSKGARRREPEEVCRNCSSRNFCNISHRHDSRQRSAASAGCSSARV